MRSENERVLNRWLQTNTPRGIRSYTAVEIGADNSERNDGRSGTNHGRTFWEDDDERQMSPAELNLLEKEGAVYTLRGALVCNFLVHDIRTVEGRYLHGPSVPLHVVLVELTEGPHDIWLLKGSLYDVASWRAAAGNSTTISSASGFRAYLHYLVDRQGIRECPPDVQVLQTVGTFCDNNGRWGMRDNVRFPFADECVYHRTTFVRTGPKQVFEDLACLSTDDTTRAVLTFVLGAALKPAWGAYPHLVITGDKESGKTSQATQICRLLGLRMVEASTEFATPYRQKKCLANTNIPVFADEVGRCLPMRPLVDSLNSAYNVQYTTRGSHGKTFVLQTPLVMLGQDFSVRDEALLSKMVCYRVRQEAKNSAAMRAVKGQGLRFPLGDYLEFVAEFANTADLSALVGEKESWLREELTDELHLCGAEADRTLFNYATQLVACRVIGEYGLRPPADSFYVDKAAEHIRGLREDGLSVPEMFLMDVKALVASGRLGSALIKKTPEGVHIHVGKTLKALRRRGNTYDISGPKTMSRLLCEKGFGRKTKPRFNGEQLRAVFVPSDQWEKLL